MKIFITISFFIACTLYSIAQPLQSGFHYKLQRRACNSQRSYFITYGKVGGYNNVTKRIYKFENENFIKKSFNRIFKNNLKANIFQTEDGILKVDIWGITGNDSASGLDQYVNSQDDLSEEYYYFIHLPKRNRMNNAVSYLSLKYATWEYGLTTVPYKYFSGNQNDSIPNLAIKDFNAGLYIGRKWGRTRFYYDKNMKHHSMSYMTTTFLSPTLISLTPETTNIKNYRSGTELGLTFGFGLMASYRDINLGLLGGWDIPMSPAGRNWNYYKEFWIGMGLGYKLNIFAK